MKKTTVLILFGFAIISLSSCKKICDYSNQHPGEEYKYCDVKKFKVWYFDKYNEFNVRYNKKGQPTDVLGVNPDLNGPNWEQHFWYDNKGRLTDWFTNLPGDNKVFVWDNYHYLDAKTIIDTSYNGDGSQLITDGHPPFTAATRRVRTLYLDNYGRIIKIDNNGAFTQIFDYAADGNLVSADPTVYDTGVNVMRTNKIWMFVNNNFNANNYAKTQYGDNEFIYNAYLLPTSITLLPEGTSNTEQFMTYFIFNKLEIVYDCDVMPKGY